MEIGEGLNPKAAMEYCQKFAKRMAAHDDALRVRATYFCSQGDPAISYRTGEYNE